MARKKLSFNEIMKLADQYGVKDNVLFVSAADRYTEQMKIIGEIHKSLGEGLLMETVGSMGQKKVEANPLVTQLPKYNEVANKTLGVMLDIVEKMGAPAAQDDELDEFRS